MSSSFVPFGKSPAAKSLVAADTDIKDHVLVNLNEKNSVSYTKIKERFDVDIAAKTENTRFALSEHVSGQMSLEKEEQIRFEKRVAEELAKQITRIREETIAVAHAEGLEAGRKEAFELERVRLAAHIESLANLIHTIEDSKTKLAAQYENVLLDVAFRLARTIVHHEIHSRPESLKFTLQVILNHIAKEDDVSVKISPNEYHALEKIRDELKQVNRSGRINFELDESLKAGDCIVESMSGEIGSFITEKFEKLHENIFRVGAAPSTPGEATGT